MQKLKKSQLKRLFTRTDGTEEREIVVLPCKMNPTSIWAPNHGLQVTRFENELYITNLDDTEDVPLDKYLDSFTAMNCNNELGYYPAFYIKN
jgi:hypothetical protein